MAATLRALLAKHGGKTMASDDWAKERAEELADLSADDRHDPDLYARLSADILAALREAEERVRAEERAHAMQALKLAQAMQEKAVAAERERIKAMLRKPDPKLRYEVAMAKHSQACDDGYSLVGGPAAEAAMFAIASHLSQTQEGE